jgi:hypothetical protein
MQPGGHVGPDGAQAGDDRAQGWDAAQVRAGTSTADEGGKMERDVEKGDPKPFPAECTALQWEPGTA